MATGCAAEPLDGAGHVGLDFVGGDAEAAGDAPVGQIVEAVHHEDLAGEFGHGDERGLHAGELGGIDWPGRFGDTGGADAPPHPPARPQAQRRLTRVHDAASRVPETCGR